MEGTDGPDDRSCRLWRTDAHWCRETHSAVDGAQGHEALHVVGEGAAVGVPVGVLASLQDQLLALEVMVLEAHPASEGERHSFL